MLYECPGQESKPKTIGGISTEDGKAGLPAYPAKYPNTVIGPVAGLHNCDALSQELQRRENPNATRHSMAEQGCAR